MSLEATAGRHFVSQSKLQENENLQIKPFKHL